MKKLLILLFLFISSVYGEENNNAKVSANVQICSEFYDYLVKNNFKDNISKAPSKKEMSLINDTKSELLEEHSSYSQGVTTIDVDNDGKNDAIIWGVGLGPDRICDIELFSIPFKNTGKKQKLSQKAYLELGSMEGPKFVRFKNKNYLLTMYDYRYDNEWTVSQIKYLHRKYQLETLCKMKRTLIADSQCFHSACRQLNDLIENQGSNNLFAKDEWSDKYRPSPDGLAIYFPYHIDPVDFDNTHNSTWIWHFRKDGKYDPVDWSLIGIGKDQPKVDFDQQSSNERTVLLGGQHDRLRKVLSEQSKVLSNALHRQILLPKEGEFFLFKTDDNKTYWAWDFGQPPFGEVIHIVYSDEDKTEYIGEVKIIKSISNLVPCKENCTEKLHRFIF